MPRYKSLPLPAEIRQLIIDESDYRRFPVAGLVNALEEIFIINRFEQTVLGLKEEGLVHGPVHTGIGQEAVAAGVGLGLDKTDLIASTHRAHHHYLSKVLSYYSPDGYNALADEFPPSMQKAMNVLLAEIMGLAPGCCGGRGGSMHLRERQAGVLGTDAIVAGGIALATGAAWAQKLKKEKRAVVSFLGDGAVNQGIFLEAANLAALWKCPVIYLIENNLYAVATGTGQATALAHLAFRAAGFPIPALIVDGMDPVAVAAAVREAKRIINEEQKPALIEAKTYRFRHHAGIHPGSKFGYRTSTEEEDWEKKNPVKSYPERLVELGICTDAEIRKLEKKAAEAVARAADFCVTAGKNGRREVRPELWPRPESVTDGVRSSGEEFRDVTFSESEDFRDFQKMKYVEAISAVVTRRMEKDDTILVLGEEVANFGGGAYQATKGIPDKFPDRIFNTPISEAGFTGLALGLALEGFRPVVEIMFPDFALVAGDQLFNQIGKLRHIYGGKVPIPVVVRTRIAIGDGYGAQHSMDPVGLFALFPGWRIFAPSTAFDYVGLMNLALKSNDPVVMIEHRELYPEAGEVPTDDLDYFIKPGKARIRKSGGDVTVITYLNGARKTLLAAPELARRGIEAEVIDLRTLDYAGIDYETVGTSLKKTGRVVIVEEAPRSSGIGSRIADEIQARFFDYLDAPVKVVASKDVPNPVSRVLEDHAILSVENIVESIAKV